MVIFELGESETGNQELVRARLNAFELVLEILNGGAHIFEGGVRVFRGRVGIGLLRLDLFEFGCDAVETLDDFFILFARHEVGRIGRRRWCRLGAGDSAEKERQCGCGRE